MNVYEIVEKYLVDHGFDGLRRDDCSCKIDNIFICGECYGDCNPGWVKDCENCELNGECDFDYCITDIKWERKEN